MDTPDTERAEMRERASIAVMRFYGYTSTQNVSQGMRSLLADFAIAEYSARDTYWKERVEETRTTLLFIGEKVLKEMSEIYAVDIKYADKKQWLEPSEFERIFLHRFNEVGLKALDTLLDNLK